MEYDRTTKRIRASNRDWDFLRKIADLRTQADIPKFGAWRERDDEFLWQCLIGEINNRGGIAWYKRLIATGRKEAFENAFSLKQLHKIFCQSETALQHHVRDQMEKFHVGRFPEDNTRSVVANFKNLVSTDGRLRSIRQQLCELDCTSQPIGMEVQSRERQARAFLMGNLIFYQRGREYRAKRKPPSDYLINVGFARTLLAFDTRMKTVFWEVFRISISDTNYEPAEDWFLSEVYPKLQITPSEFDRIIFQKEKDVLELGRHIA